jgi:putative transposase
MAELFKNKYRIPSARLEGWDYSSNAMYFITICTKERKKFFGEIKDGKMILSATGKLCEDYLYKIPVFSPFVLIDEAIIMPNHLHAIIVIDHPVETFEKTSLVEKNPPFFQTDNPLPETFFQTSLHSSISPKPGSLSTIVRSFKGAVKKDSKSFDPSFEWQPRFHDHIIRNRKSYWNIKKYIQANADNWNEDRFFDPS